MVLRWRACEKFAQVNVGKDGIVGYAIYVKPDIREWPMISDDIFVDDAEITTNTHIWGSCF